MPEPTQQGSDAKGLFLDYLDYFRSVVTAKVNGMTDEELRASKLPSGWTPLELLNHLGHMEQRWLRWGFAAEAGELTDIAAIGGRFTADSTPPTLLSILFHVLQEYARHAGHIDVVRELTDGTTGE